MTTSASVDRASGLTPRAAPRVVLLHGGDDAPAWRGRADATAVSLAPPGDDAREAARPAVLVDAVAGAGCVLVDADTLDPLPVARRVHQADAEVQVVVVVAAEERRRTLERAMLFAHGVGEVWLASPTEVAGALAERAAGVTRQRRKFRHTRERMERERLTASPQRAERALISDEYLANLLQVLPDPIFSVDAAGRILSANPAATARLLATAVGEAPVGAPLADALGLREAAVLPALLAAATERPAIAELAFRRADGATGHGELLVTRVAASEPAFYAVVLHDLTERRQAQQQLEDQALELEHQTSTLQDQTVELEQANEELLRQRGELEAALDARGRFYAAMNHELRTPINAVIGYTALALDGLYGPVAEPLRDALVRSQRAATHLHELVDDVLDLAKIEAGRIEVVREAVDPAALVEDILLSVRPTAEASGTPLAFECDGTPATPLVTDPRRVRQILLNLLGNALKFGVGRPVTIRCAQAPGGVTFAVVDQGSGIPEREQQRVFEEFVQLQPNRHRGTGLGLPISRRLAELLGGTLTVASAPGHGSTFTLTLPRS